MDIVEFYNKIENLVRNDKTGKNKGYTIISNKRVGIINMTFKDWGHYIKICNLRIVTILKGNIKIEETKGVGQIVVKSELIGLMDEQKLKVIKGLFKIMKELENGALLFLIQL